MFLKNRELFFYIISDLFSSFTCPLCETIQIYIYFFHFIHHLLKCPLKYNGTWSFRKQNTAENELSSLCVLGRKGLTLFTTSGTPRWQLQAWRKLHSSLMGALVNQTKTPGAGPWRPEARPHRGAGSGHPRLCALAFTSATLSMFTRIPVFDQRREERGGIFAHQGNQNKIPQTVWLKQQTFKASWSGRQKSAIQEGPRLLPSGAPLRGV